MIIYCVHSIGMVSCKDQGLPEKFTNKQIEHQRQLLQVSKEESYIIDSSYYPSLMRMHTSFDSGTIQKHYQPLQALYFDNKGILVSYHVNCTADTDTGVNWNKQKVFDKFPPATSAPVDSVFSSTDLLSFVRDFDGNPVKTVDSLQYDYTVVVFWTSRMMKQEARDLVAVVKQNVSGKRVKTFFVNVDNMWH